MERLYAKCIVPDNNLKGRIGGNPPKAIEEQIPDGYKFYATIVHPEKENIMLSVLVHEDFGFLVEHNIYPSIAVKIIEHEYSVMGSDTNRSIPTLGLGSISEYTTQENDYLFVTTGGEPVFIQNKSFYYAALEKDGYSFFLQIDEEGYNDDLGYEDYVFLYGALYLYRHYETGEIIAGFWQCS